VLVIERNGRTTVIAFMVLGLAITLGAILLIVLPVAIGVAILASLLQSRPR
jgi:hypothetical protein